MRLVDNLQETNPAANGRWETWIMFVPILVLSIKLDILVLSINLLNSPTIRTKKKKKKDLLASILLILGFPLIIAKTFTKLDNFWSKSFIIPQTLFFSTHNLENLNQHDHKLFQSLLNIKAFLLILLYTLTTSLVIRTTSKICLPLTKVAYRREIVESSTSLNLRDKTLRIILYKLITKFISLKSLIFKALSFSWIRREKVVLFFC